MENKPNNQNRLFSLKLVKKLLISLIIIFIFEFFLFPAPVLASEYEDTSNISDNTLIDNNGYPESLEMDTIINNTLPQNSTWETVRAGFYEITAYTSEVGQCDASPCITANGFNLCQHGIEDSIAANFLRFGAKVRIPELYGDKVFVVRDRMNSRYQDRVDIWMKDKTQALKFGLKYARIEILEEP